MAYGCVSHKRFSQYLDPFTQEEFHMDSGSRMHHVRTMNLNIISNNVLRNNLIHRLNHIPFS
jgi:hypothetical protein